MRPFGVRGLMNAGKPGETLAIANSDGSSLTYRPAPAALLFLDPLVGKCHWRPAIATPLLVQATQAGKQHMRPRDHDILARELRQQLLPCRCSRSRVGIEDHRELGMLQLDTLCMHGVAPKQDLLSLRRKLIAGMSRGMTRQRDEL